MLAAISLCRLLCLKFCHSVKPNDSTWQHWTTGLYGLIHAVPRLYQQLSPHLSCGMKLLYYFIIYGPIRIVGVLSLNLKDSIGPFQEQKRTVCLVRVEKASSLNRITPYLFWFHFLWSFTKGQCSHFFWLSFWVSHWHTPYLKGNHDDSTHNTKAYCTLWGREMFIVTMIFCQCLFYIRIITIILIVFNPYKFFQQHSFL